MSRRTIETMRRAYAAMNRGDLDAAVEGFDAQVEWWPPETMPERRAYRGREEVKQRLVELIEPWSQVSFEVDEINAEGERLLVGVRIAGRGRGSGADVEARFYNVVTDRDGIPVRIENYLDREQALRAAGLAE
jgi:ketosteroid isomerase-like protein